VCQSNTFPALGAIPFFCDDEITSPISITVPGTHPFIDGALTKAVCSPDGGNRAVAEEVASLASAGGGTVFSMLI
jgi:hypothetical protein